MFSTFLLTKCRIRGASRVAGTVFRIRRSGRSGSDSATHLYELSDAAIASRPAAAAPDPANRRRTDKSVSFMCFGHMIVESPSCHINASPSAPRDRPLAAGGRHCCPLRTIMYRKQCLSSARKKIKDTEMRTMGPPVLAGAIRARFRYGKKCVQICLSFVQNEIGKAACERRLFCTINLQLPRRVAAEE